MLKKKSLRILFKNPYLFVREPHSRWSRTVADVSGFVKSPIDYSYLSTTMRERESCTSRIYELFLVLFSTFPSIIYKYNIGR